MSESTDEVKGRVKEAAGAVTGNEHLKNEGKLDQAGAKVKQAADDLAGKVEEGVDAVKDMLHHKK